MTELEKMKKDELLEKAEEVGVDVEPRMTKAEIATAIVASEQRADGDAGLPHTLEGEGPTPFAEADAADADSAEEESAAPTESGEAQDASPDEENGEGEAPQSREADDADEAGSDTAESAPQRASRARGEYAPASPRG